MHVHLFTYISLENCFITVGQISHRIKCGTNMCTDKLYQD